MVRGVLLILKRILVSNNLFAYFYSLGRSLIYITLYREIGFSLDRYVTSIMQLKLSKEQKPLWRCCGSIIK